MAKLPGRKRLPVEIDVAPAERFSVMSGKKSARATPTRAAVARSRSCSARMSGRRWSRPEGTPPGSSAGARVASSGRTPTASPGFRPSRTASWCWNCWAWRSRSGRIACVTLTWPLARCRSSADATPTSYWRWMNFRLSTKTASVRSVMWSSASVVAMLK